ATSTNLATSPRALPSSEPSPWPLWTPSAAARKCVSSWCPVSRPLRPFMSSCLVTGGAGFIGSPLVQALGANGPPVRVLDNFSTGSSANLARTRGRIELVTGDLADLGQLREATEGAEIVFHQAALASVQRSVADPFATHQACANGTLNVLLAAREARVRRVI